MSNSLFVSWVTREVSGRKDKSSECAQGACAEAIEPTGQANNEQLNGFRCTTATGAALWSSSYFLPFLRLLFVSFVVFSFSSSSSHHYSTKLARSFAWRHCPCRVTLGAIYESEQRSNPARACKINESRCTRTPLPLSQHAARVERAPSE